MTFQRNGGPESLFVDTDSAPNTFSSTSTTTDYPLVAITTGESVLMSFYAYLITTTRISLQTHKTVSVGLHHWREWKEIEVFYLSYKSWTIDRVCLLISTSPVMETSPSGQWDRVLEALTMTFQNLKCGEE